MQRLAPIACVLLATCTVVARYTMPPEACHNGVDDDADGMKDCEDPECRCEDRFVYCADSVDNDRDGLEDAQEPVCWTWSDVTAGPRECSSLLATELELDGFADRNGRRSEGPWLLEGGDQCAGLGLVSETCGYLHATEPMSGGACWSVTVDLDFVPDGRDGELALVLAPEMDPDGPPLAARGGLVIGLKHDAARGGVQLRASTGEPTIYRDEPGPFSGPLRLRATTGPECRGDRVHVDVLGEDGARVLDLGPELLLPADWSKVVVSAGLQAAAAGSVRIDAVRVERERDDPCGFAVPQITAGAPGDDDAFAAVLAAASGGGRICAIGVTPSGPLVEPKYDPIRHQGTPPTLPPGDADAPSLPFASWWIEDQGIESFSAGSPQGPFHSIAPGGHVRSGVVAWDEASGAFEAILLASDDPQRGGALVRATSEDCAQWTFEPLPTLEGVGALHPLLYEIDAGSSSRHLVLAEPAEAYSSTMDPACADRQVEHYPADSVPLIKPWGSLYLGYPRLDLFWADSEDGETWEVEDPGVSGPAHARWRIGACMTPPETFVPERSWPAAVSQLITAGGYRAFVTSGKLGLDVVVDYLPNVGLDADDVDDAQSLAAPLLTASGQLGTFDAARVRDGFLLLLDRTQPGEQDALLFYRGFRAERVFEDEGRVRYEGGAVGVVPVRFERGVGSVEKAGE